MIDNQRRIQKQQEKERTRKRMRVEIDPDNYTYIPAKKPIDFYDNEVNQRVGIYVRVSTDDVRQTTSFELQKKYYEDFVVRHPNWTLVKIYADEGISGTSLAHRDEFNRMISDCRAGKLDLIITKSVSRFARNIMICIGVVRELSELNPPAGVFFESECIFSLNEDSQMALSFQATMAEEESHIRSRSMETSLRMRLDNGIPLTPKLLGYTHDIDGNLVINQEEAPTVKLAYTSIERLTTFSAFLRLLRSLPATNPPLSFNLSRSDLGRVGYSSAVSVVRIGVFSLSQISSKLISLFDHNFE